MSRRLFLFVIRGEVLTLSPHVPRTSPLFSPVFPGPVSYLPLRGTFPARGLTIRGKSAVKRPSGIASYNTCGEAAATTLNLES